jgi:hypothetical protein
MVIRVISVPDVPDLPDFDEVFRTVLGWEGLGFIFRRWLGPRVAAALLTTNERPMSGTGSTRERGKILAEWW